MAVTETDLELGSGRRLHVYDTGPSDARMAIFWHHGTPNIGAPPEPLMPAAAERGMRWVSHDRPGYGGSTPQPGRVIASTAADVARIADSLGIERFAVMGHSGGSTHALACAALLPDRVVATVSVSGLAPVAAEGIDWSAGMHPAVRAELGAAAAGRAELERYLAATRFDETLFTEADHRALRSIWSWMNIVAGKGTENGFGGFIDDDVAFVSPWEFSLNDIRRPVLVVQGGQDVVAPPAHGRWLAHQIPSAELWLRPEDGHISALNAGIPALDWLQSGV